jgi:hypothetical protein
VRAQSTIDRFTSNACHRVIEGESQPPTVHAMDERSRAAVSSATHRTKS